jgi:hypothetical protein
VKIILYRDKHLQKLPWKDINTKSYRDHRIWLYDLFDIEQWLTDRELTLNMENVRHKDADGRWIVTTFWADLTHEQQIELSLTLG